MIIHRKYQHKICETLPKAVLEDEKRGQRFQLKVINGDVDGADLRDLKSSTPLHYQCKANSPYQAYKLIE